MDHFYKGLTLTSPFSFVTITQEFKSFYFPHIELRLFLVNLKFESLLLLR